MGAKDFTITIRFQQASHKFIRHDAKNEILDIMSKQVLSKKPETIRKRHFYSMTCDQGTDCSNIEQLSFNIERLMKILI